MDFLKLADPALAKQYSARPKADPTPKRRAKVIEGIDRTIQQLRANEEAPKRGWYSSRADIVKAKVKHGNRDISINGATEFFIPKERAVDFYTGVKQSVRAGQLDKAINAAVEGTTQRSTGTRRKRGPMTEEQKHQRNIKRYGEARADAIRAAKGN